MYIITDIAHKSGMILYAFIHTYISPAIYEDMS